MTFSGEDVRRALLGWAKCPDCGRWCEPEKLPTIADHYLWACQHDNCLTRPKYSHEMDWWIGLGDSEAPTPYMQAKEAWQMAQGHALARYPNVGPERLEQLEAMATLEMVS